MLIKEGLVICDSAKKKEILSNQTGVLNYTFLSMNELKIKLFGTVKKKAIFMLMDKYIYPYEKVIEFIKYIPFVENKLYADEKLDSLVAMKKYLIENDLIEIDKFFIAKLKNTNVTFINPILDKMFKRILDIIKEYTTYDIVLDNNTSYTHDVLVYKDQYEEALATFEKIYDLHKKGVSYNNIYILNSNDYSFVLSRLSLSFNIPIDLNTTKNINSLDEAKRFLAYLDDEKSFEDILAKLSSSSIVYDKVLSIINDYEIAYDNPKKYKSFFYKAFKNASYPKSLYEEMVNTSGSSFSDNDYVFYLGLNLGSVPSVYKDDEYLNDSELDRISLNTSIIKNKLARDELNRIIKTTKNLYLSYKENDSDGKCLPSTIIGNLNLECKMGSLKYGYSKTEDYIRFGSKYTNYLKYKVLDEDLKKYDWSFIKYNSYDNKYKMIDKNHILKKYQRKEPEYSYSSLKTYFECPFAYYANRILGLNEFEQSLATRLGTYSHGVLEDSYKEGFDFDESVLKYTKQEATTAKEKFYFKQMEEVLKELISFNRSYIEQSELKQVKTEANIKVKYDGYSFIGFIDKLMYQEIDGEIYAAIIDYKTGGDVVSLDNVEYGFHLQLPSYMYLLRNYEPFKGKKINILGIYLQKVNIIALDNTKDILTQRREAFKLQGYTLANLHLVPLLDKTYNKSEYIRSLATTKDGAFYSRAKVITEKDVDYLVFLVEGLIKTADMNIRDAKFEIAPKAIDGKDQSCTFCKYKDLCFKKYEDIINLEPKAFPKKDGE